MNDEPKGFFQRKTTWAAITSIGAGITGYATKQADPMSALMLIMQGVIALCIRSPIGKLEQAIVMTDTTPSQ